MSRQQRHTSPILLASTARRWVCLLLCVVTWRGPVVWVHEHEMNPAAASVALSDHLRDFDHSGSVASHFWHFHLLLPWSPKPADPQHQDDTSPEDPLSQARVLLNAAASAQGFKECASWAWGSLNKLDGRFLAGTAVTTLCRRPRPAAAVGFTTSLLDTAPLTAVTGVARC